MKFLKRPSPRLLVTIAITLVMLSLHFAGAMMGLLPDTEALKRDGRAALAEVLTVRTVRALADSDLETLEQTLELLLERNQDILSAAVRRADGDALVRVGEHEGNWDKGERSYSTDAQLTVPIMEGGRRWGQLELRFVPLRKSGWRGFLDRPLTRYGVYLGIIGFIALYLVLGKMLRHLDPSKAVPARVRSALDTMMEGLIAIDLKGQVVLANQAFAAVAGKTPEALLGTNINRLRWQLSDAERDAGHPWALTLRDGIPRKNAQIHFVDGDSKVRTFLANCSPVMGGEGAHVGVLVGLGDVTELEEKEIELRISKDRAEAANRAKSEFLANMSHEIRTPMNAILGFTEMLRRGYARTEDDNRKYLNTIHKSGSFLLRLINDLLDMSKIEAGSLQLERVACPAHDIANEVVNALSVTAAERDIELALDIHTPVPATISTDPTRLRQIITNLVGNAIKFTEQGSVRVGVRYEPDSSPGVIAIDITDTGIGMSAEQVSKIFDPFVQADRTITRRFGGTGLGLSISRRFAEALGGSIDVTSVPGAGSTFTVRVDVGSLDGVEMLSSDEALQQSVETTDEEVTSWTFPAARVLVADDNRQNRDLLHLVLSEHGLEVIEAENGREAVAAASAQPFDVILMDLEMPIMDGAAATRTLRDGGATSPILALTAHPLQSVEKTIREAGFSEHISKPIDINALLARLAELLGAQERGDARDTQAEAGAPVRSRLPVEDPRYRAIVKEFTSQLDQRIDEMQRNLEERDFETLARHAHSLKGMGGTAGFDELTAPGKALESAAHAGATETIALHLREIRSLAARIDIEPGPPAQSAPATATIAPIVTTAPIRSRLPVADPRYRAIVVDFIDDLEPRLCAMAEALEGGDFDALAGFAHGLKGVAGGVGFSEFTEPTRLLETAAQAADRQGAESSFATLRALAARVERPAEQAGKQAATR